MKMLWLIPLLILVSCQETTKTTDRQIEKVSPVEDDELNDHESFMVSAIGGKVELSGESISRKNNLSLAENLKVTETSSQHLLDEFSLFDWGPVGFIADATALKVYPKSNLEITYQLDDQKKLIRTTKCEFKSKPEPVRLKEILASTKSANPDWEGIFDGISQLAYDGDKSSYNFFMNPDAEATALLKHSDGAASTEPIVKVLKFMKANGCNW